MGQIAYTAWGRGLRRVLGLLAAWGRWGPRWGVLSMTQLTTCGEDTPCTRASLESGFGFWFIARDVAGNDKGFVMSAPGRGPGLN